MRLLKIPKKYKKYLPTVDARQVQILLGIAILMISMFLFGKAAGLNESDEYHRLIDKGKESVMGVADEDEKAQEVEKTETIIEANDDDKDQIEMPEQRVAEIRQSVSSFIPSEYDVVEKELETPHFSNNGCAYILEMIPKVYTESDKKYLHSATITYCVDIHDVVIYDQAMIGVHYNESLNGWVYGEMTTVMEQKLFGDNLVTLTESGGSHAWWRHYLLGLDGSNELIILTLPVSNRIRCDTFEEGVEVINQDCMDYTTSIGIKVKELLWVPESLYKDYFDELLELLKYNYGSEL